MNTLFLRIIVFICTIQFYAGLVLADQQGKLVPQNAPTPPVTQPPATATANQDIRDIYGPIPLPDQINWHYYLLGLIILIAIISLLFLYLKRKRVKKAPKIAPHVTALAELAQARDFIVNNQSLNYASRASEILRNYIEKRFDIRTTRQTTSEFLYTIQANQGDLLLPYKEPLRLCLERCDLAKYAHKTAEQESLEEMEGSIRHFIEDTLVEPEEK